MTSKELREAIEGQIRQICTWHKENGWSGYNLSEEQFEKIFKLIQDHTADLTEKLKELESMRGRDG